MLFLPFFIKWENIFKDKMSYLPSVNTSFVLAGNPTSKATHEPYPHVPTCGGSSSMPSTSSRCLTASDLRRTLSSRAHMWWLFLNAFYALSSPHCVGLAPPLHSSGLAAYWFQLAATAANSRLPPRGTKEASPGTDPSTAKVKKQTDW